MAKSQAMDGRQSFAWILDVAATDTEASSSTNLEAGKIVIVTGMADSESGFGSNKNLIILEKFIKSIMKILDKIIAER